MERGERTCIVSGTKYVYCPSCGKGDPTETWRNLFCCESCREVFDVVSKYKNGHITPGEALMKLKSPMIDLSKKDSFGDEYKDAINEIIAKNEKSSKEGDKQEKPFKKVERRKEEKNEL